MRPADAESAQALRTFLAWPGPGGATRHAVAERHPGPRRLIAASVLTLLVGVACAALSLVLPLSEVPGHAWSLGSHLLLLCHLG